MQESSLLKKKLPINSTEYLPLCSSAIFSFLEITSYIRKTENAMFDILLLFFTFRLYCKHLNLKKTVT